MKGGINMEEIEQKIYDYIKSFTEEKEFPPTTQQIAETLNIKKHEAQEAVERLEKSGKIKITRTSIKTGMTFSN